MKQQVHTFDVSSYLHGLNFFFVNIVSILLLPSSTQSLHISFNFISHALFSFCLVIFFLHILHYCYGFFCNRCTGFGKKRPARLPRLCTSIFCRVLHCTRESMSRHSTAPCRAHVSGLSVGYLINEMIGILSQTCVKKAQNIGGGKLMIFVRPARN